MKTIANVLLLIASAGFVTVACGVREADAILALGDEFAVNTYTSLSQMAPAVASTGGSFVVVWDSDGQDGSREGVFARRYDRSGTASGAEFQVNTYTSGVQYMAEVAAHADGSFVVVWTSRDAGLGGQDGSGAGCFGQRFDAGGTALGSEFAVNSYVTGTQDRADVATAAGGGFLVVWESQAQDGDGAGVFARRFGADGSPLGTEVQVNAYTTGDQARPVVCRTSDDGFIVVWDGNGSDPDGFGVFGHRLSPAGSPLDADFQINTFTTGSQSNAAVACATGDGFVVAWESAYQDSPEATTGVFARRYNNGAIPLTNEFAVNTYTTGAQGMPAVAQADGGGFVIGWQSADQDGGGAFPDTAVLARAFDDQANPTGGEFQVNVYTTGLQNDPSLAFVGPAGLVAAWSSDTSFTPFTQDGSEAGVFARRLVSGSTTTSSTTTTTLPSTTTTIASTTTSTTLTTTTTGTTLSPTTTTTLAAGNACGDANQDSAVTATDALIALATAVGSDSCPACLCDAAPPNPDITATDALVILQAAVGGLSPVCSQTCA